MIEATCAACGTVNRIAEADVPAGAKFVSCTSCKSKVPVAATAGAKPAIPGLPGKNIAIPAIPPKIPTPAKGMPAAPKKDAALELADLPAPKRQSPLAGTEASAGKAVPRSPLSGMESARANGDGAELPAPKSTAKPPAPQAGSLDLDDLMPPADGAPSAAQGAMPSGPHAGVPSGPHAAVASGPHAASAHSLAGLADLPAPKAKTSSLADLPAPKSAPRSALADLPAPKKPATSALSDLPAPKAAVLDDLPAPKGVSRGSLELDDVDLPAPKQGITDLPAPKPGANNDLLAPKGFFEELPQPARGGGTIDLPAPKGFFDDLPQPATGKSQDLAPKGFFDDLPQPATGKSQDLAPKGFFDDLPRPATGKSQDLAPKGFFDELPQPGPAKAPEPAKGFFDDLPNPTANKAAEAGGKGFFDDLPHPTPAKPASQGNALFDDLPQPNKGGPGLFDDLQPPGTAHDPGAMQGSGRAQDLGAPGVKSAANAALGAGDIDLGPTTSGPSLDLASDGPELDLGLGLSAGQDQAFPDLDLSEPSKPPPLPDASPIKIKTPAKGAEKKPIAINVPGKPGGELKLDLADDPHDGKGAPAAVASGAAKLAQKRRVAEGNAEARVAKRKRSRVLLASALGVIALGAGGFFFYQRHAAQQAKQNEIATQLAKADKALRAEDATHWDRARTAANEALALDSANSRASGLAAEAAIAGALDNGKNRDARIAEGRKLIQDALGQGRPSPELDRAQAVAAIAAKGQAHRAIDLLKAQIAKSPKDGWLQLYLGWAQLANGDAAEAQKAFDQAMTLAPATKLPALYGQGQAKLLVADVAGARASFATILDASKDHICAQVGLIATKPPSESKLQVDELEAVLQRKDIGAADPRCVVQAHTLIGDVHRLAGRLDMARQRYRDALKLVPLDVPTHNGLAAIELRDGKLTVAGDHIQKALAASPDNADSLLLQAELFVREGKLPEAETIIDNLSARKPPLPTLAQARLHVVRGRLLETKGSNEAAVDAFIEGAKLAGDLDLTPTMAAVTKLADMAKQEADPAKAAAYRARADQLLSALAERALEDAQLSTMIGVSYLQAGDPAKAETYLRRAAALKEDDPEAKLQLAKVYNALARPADAIAQLQAALKLDPMRTEIALELARTYQNAGRHDEAVAAFEKLLAAPDVPIVVRVNAGRYFARRGLMDRAAAQASAILAAEPENPGGLYLQAEGLIAAGKPEEASPLLIKASDIDPDAQYLDALGRAYEAQLTKSKDTKYIESARFAYERAAKADPQMFHPWLGQGRMLVARKDWEPAIAPLQAASKLDSSHAEVRYYMGAAYFGMRNASTEYKKVGAGWLEAAFKGRPELALPQRAEASYMLGELYDDLNRAADSARAWENATRLGEDLERQTGAAPAWLTEIYYDLGDVYYKIGNKPAQKRAWQRYVDRKPAAGSVRLKTALNALATELQRY